MPAAGRLHRLRAGAGRLAAGLGAAALVSTSAWASVSGAGPELEADLQRLLAEEGLAGAVYALVSGDKQVVGALGWAHAPSRTPMRSDHRVQVGSVAKPVLSLAMLRLATMQHIALETPLQALLPAPALRNPWAASHPVQLRHLLDHSAGLEDMRLWHLFNRQHGPDMPLADNFSQHPGLLRLRTPPGTRMSYSNLGYVLVGMVIEQLSGERYEHWARRELLQPLGMLDSGFDFSSQTGPGAEPRLAWGHLSARQPHAAMPVAARPASQFTTTAGDMAQLTRFMLGTGAAEEAPAGSAFIHPDWLAGMGRPVGTDAAHAGLEAGYALGLARRDRHGQVALCHEGSQLGFRAMWCLCPAQRSGFFIAFNTDSETASHGRFYQRLWQALAHPPPASAAGEPASGGAATAPGVPTQTAPRPWLGRYLPSPSRFEQFALLDLLFQSRQLEMPAGQLLWRGAGGADALFPAAGVLWRQPGRVEASLALLRDASGGPLVSTGYSSYQPIGELRWWSLAMSTGAGLGGLVWWALAPLWRGLRRRRWPGDPAGWAVWALPAAAAAMAWCGWQALGQATTASVGLWAASAALLPAMAWQLWHSARLNTGPGRGAALARALDLIAAVAVLQACLVLAAWGLWPLALWR